MEINLSKFGKIISSDETSNTILLEIEPHITASDVININAENVVISTKSARLIFGKLYKRLTKKVFNEKIHFLNASTSFMFAINEGILTEIES